MTFTVEVGHMSVSTYVFKKTDEDVMHWTNLVGSISIA